MDELQSAHRNFAVNLMMFSTSKGTIASVCRDLGMNRQQFNKYLSGANLPNRATLGKLAQYFKIDERKFFEDLQPQAIQSRPLAPSAATDSQSISELLAANIAQIIERNDPGFLKIGVYNFFVPWIADPAKCIRGVLLIYKLGNATCFMRYTKLQDLETPGPHHGIGKHLGIVVENGGRTYLVGKNVRGLGEMSLISFGPSNLHNRGVLTGIGLLTNPFGEPFAARVSARFLGDKSMLRAAIRQAGVVSLDSIGDSGYLRQSVEAKIDWEYSRLFPFDFFELYRDSLSKPTRRE